MIEIIKNPNEKQINEDLKKCDLLTIIHDCPSEKEILDIIEKFKNDKDLKVSYIHYYSKENQYTIGLKKND